MNCIGIDVSKQELVTYDGKKERIFPNTQDLPELSDFLHKKGDDVTVVFEPTSTYSRWLETLCQREKIPCCYLNPRVIPHLREVAQERSKTDRSDAELLYQYGQEKGTTEARLLQQDALGHALTICLACYSLAQKARVAYQGLLEALTHDPATPQEIIRDLKGEVTHLRRQEEGEMERAQRLIRDDEEASAALLSLLTIPGLGPVTATTLLALFRRYPGTNRREIVALVGLDPIQRRSGTSVRGKPRISKRGNPNIRKRLYEATLAAARYNPAVRALYHRLKENGKPEKAARTAAARKLLLIAHAIYRNGESYHAPESKKT